MSMSEAVTNGDCLTSAKASRFRILLDLSCTGLLVKTLGEEMRDPGWRHFFFVIIFLYGCWSSKDGPVYGLIMMVDYYVNYVITGLSCSLCHSPCSHKQAKQGVVESGMVGYRFNTIGVSDGISMGTKGDDALYLCTLAPNEIFW